MARYEIEEITPETKKPSLMQEAVEELAKTLDHIENGVLSGLEERLHMFLVERPIANPVGVSEEKEVRSPLRSEIYKLQDQAERIRRGIEYLIDRIE